MLPSDGWAVGSGDGVAAYCQCSFIECERIVVVRVVMCRCGGEGEGRQWGFGGMRVPS
jgi:hypothetical protein